MRIVAVAGAVLSLVFAVGARAEEPSVRAVIDCVKAVTRVEKALCASRALMAENDERAAFYDAAIRTTSPEFSDSILAEQRRWLEERNRCETSDDVDDCLDKLNRDLDLTAALDRDMLPVQVAIARIATDPRGSAAVFRRYAAKEFRDERVSVLANYWLYFLGHHEPGAGVTRNEAEKARKRIIRFEADMSPSLYKKLRPDDPASLLRTVYQDVLADEAIPGNERYYIPCANRILFERHPDLAARAFGVYYRSRADMSAPFCHYDGPFVSKEWQALDKAFGGTSVYRKYMSAASLGRSMADIDAADYRVRALIGLFHPEQTMTARLRREKTKGIAALRAGLNANLRLKEDIAKALAAIGPAEQVYARWLMENRNLSETDAKRATEGAMGAYLAFQMFRSHQPRGRARDF